MVDVRVTITVEGKGGVQDMLQRAVDALSPDNLREATHKGAEILVDSVRGFVPVGGVDSMHPGALKASVGAVELDDSPTGWSVNPYVNASEEVYKYARVLDEGGTASGYQSFSDLRGGSSGDWTQTFVTEHVGKNYMELGFEAGEEEAAMAVMEHINASIEG